jgi:hypothetical protein
MEIVAFILFMVQLVAWFILPSGGKAKELVSTPDYASIGDEVGVAA